MMKFVLIIGLLSIVLTRGKVIFDDKIIADDGSESTAQEKPEVSSALDSEEDDGKILDLVRVPRQHPAYGTVHPNVIQNPSYRSLSLLTGFLGNRDTPKPVLEPIYVPVPYAMPNDKIMPHIMHPMNAPCPLQHLPQPSGFNLPQHIIQKLLSSSLSAIPSGISRSDDQHQMMGMTWPVMSSPEGAIIAQPYTSSSMMLLDPSGSMRAVDSPMMYMEHPSNPAMTSSSHLDPLNKLKRDSNLNTLESVLLNSA